MRPWTGVLVLGLASLAAIPVLVDQVGCREDEAGWEFPVLIGLSTVGFVATAVGLFFRIPRDVFGRPLVPIVVSLFALGLSWALGIALAAACLPAD
jgi:hypothetical protein